MREIKFRAWDKDENRMYQDVDVLRNGEIIYFEIDEYGDEPIHWYNNYGESYEEEFVDAFIVMQFTGLRDRSGNEIYEGDVLLNNDGVNGKVFFEEGLGAYAVEFPNYNMLLMDYKAEHYDTMEILGNIYQNPELIEGETK